MVGETKWNLLELPLPKKKSKAKAMLHSWGLQGLPSSRSEGCDVVIPTIPIQLYFD